MKFNLSQNDFYTKKAKKDGYPARSVYKLKEIDEKFRIFRDCDRVLDLGAAPGSWLLYISQKIGQNGKVVGYDTEDLKIDLSVNSFFIKKSVFDNDLISFLGKEKFNVVVSDLSPNTTGIKDVDAAKCLDLSNRALEIAKNVLVENGNFVCKLFEGGEVDEFIKEVRQNFELVKKYRPKAVRRNSKEIYLVAKNFYQ